MYLIILREKRAVSFRAQSIAFTKHGFWPGEWRERAIFVAVLVTGMGVGIPVACLPISGRWPFRHQGLGDKFRRVSGSYWPLDQLWGSGFLFSLPKKRFGVVAALPRPLPSCMSLLPSVRWCKLGLSNAAPPDV